MVRYPCPESETLSCLPWRNTLSQKLLLQIAATTAVEAICIFVAAQTPSSTMFRNSALSHMDYAGLIGRSDIVLARPNLEPGQAMPLGNGLLGVAVWSEDGLTAQLNRVDTLPDRLPLARVTVPGLATLTAAKDYSGRLDVFNAEFHEQGAALRATIFVDSTSDTLVIEVTGANPNQPQKVNLSLAPPRAPKAEASRQHRYLERSMDRRQATRRLRTKLRLAGCGHGRGPRCFG